MTNPPKFVAAKAVPMSERRAVATFDLQPLENRTMSTELSTIPHNDPFAAYAAQAFRGEFLKFVKGDYLAGAEGRPMNGAKLIVLMTDTVHGWQKWRDGKIADERLGLVAGFRPPLRDDLGDDDEGLWETDAIGARKDPWAFVIKIPMVSQDGNEEYVFTAASLGAKKAFAALCKAYGRRQSSAALPIISLEVETYIHSTFGRVKTPLFKVVDWQEPDGVAALPAPSAAPARPALAPIDDDIPF